MWCFDNLTRDIMVTDTAIKLKKEILAVFLMCVLQVLQYLWEMPFSFILPEHVLLWKNVVYRKNIWKVEKRLRDHLSVDVGKDGLSSLKWRESSKRQSFWLLITTSKTSRQTNSGRMHHTGKYAKNGNTNMDYLQENRFTGNFSVLTTLANYCSI